MASSLKNIFKHNQYMCLIAGHSNLMFLLSHQEKCSVLLIHPSIPPSCVYPDSVPGGPCVS